ncbi:efflux RND transporter periplasmic adaptor subunit [Porifericola rhodea]|uniref:efflux RND transporter periplasmic adaptor subunit n=1 Tax=Porifericola rhodea TaxID=930972 RepID=UPI002664E934|nr:efflux RND transporter periplasmic adaptor subunit [Porifericola rhodea]WKN32185.1 efflux RND transporter periplasmic adaptor subunit [Porifericola rhodea]
MKSLIYILFSIIISVSFTACEQEHEHEGEDHHEHDEEGHHDDDGVHFSVDQFNALDMKVGALTKRNLLGVVESSGVLEVPPQNEATITAIVGANITSIKVIEGDDVKKGQVLAYLSHPNLTRFQSDYLEAYNSLQFLEKEFQRQKRLYEGEVSSGKTFQQTQSDYQSRQVMVKSYESQLRQLGMNPKRLQEGSLYEQVPVISPLEGSVTMIGVKTGQYVQPEKELFEVVNTHHIHADLMVFEKDIYKVEVGQKVRFRVETLPDQELIAEIYSVGKKFEPDPKAVHVHAEIENSSGKLIPGMYIKGEILTDSVETYALPEEALVREGDQYMAFVAEQENGDEKEWKFSPLSVTTGNSSNGWVEVAFAEQPSSEAQFVMNNAYYLIAEMKKSEAGHSH